MIALVLFILIFRDFLLNFLEMVKLALMLSSWLGLLQLMETAGVAEIGENTLAMVEFYMDATVAIYPSGASRVHGKLIKLFRVQFSLCETVRLDSRVFWP